MIFIVYTVNSYQGGWFILLYLMWMTRSRVGHCEVINPRFWRQTKRLGVPACYSIYLSIVVRKR